MHRTDFSRLVVALLLLAFFSSQQSSKQKAMKAQHIAAVAVLLLGAQLASAQKVGPVDFAQDCPGNLLVNGGFEEPNTETKWTQLPDPTSNSKWGWYEDIPGRQQGQRWTWDDGPAAASAVASCGKQQHTHTGVSLSAPLQAGTQRARMAQASVSRPTGVAHAW